MNVHALADKPSGTVRIQIWSDERPGHGLTASAHISIAEAEKLISRIRAAIDELPREVSGADLGIAA